MFRVLFATQSNLVLIVLITHIVDGVMTLVVLKAAKMVHLTPGNVKDIIPTTNVCMGHVLALCSIIRSVIDPIRS